MLMRFALLLLVVLAIGCATRRHAVAPGPWSPAYDKEWAQVCECWGGEPEKPPVRVRTDCVGEFPQHFPLVPEGIAYGQLTGGVVEVCPDLWALRHEFSHWVSRKLHGDPGRNGDGKCWL